MDERRFHEELAGALDRIQTLLSRSLEIQEQSTETEKAIHALEKHRTETTSGLLEFADTESAMAQQRTGLAEERTALVREQTRLSTRSTELATIRTDLSRERTGMAGQRTDLAVLRTDFSRARTNLAEQRTRMAGTRTIFSKVRTELARGRTYLALIRTGLALLALSVAFFRHFSLSWWSVFDVSLGLGSLAMTFVGLSGYWRSSRLIKMLETGTVEAKELTV
jgi:chromosome segregation ATPase